MMVIYITKHDRSITHVTVTFTTSHDKKKVVESFEIMMLYNMAMVC